MKVTVVGAGAVGASCAEYIAIKDFASEVVILDIKEGFAEGKAMDLMQTASLNSFDTKITGTTGIPKNRIIGMGGALDSARFKYRLAEALGAPISDVDGMVIGGHSDKGMVPLTRLATRNSIPVSEFISEDRLEQVLQDTKVGGATLTGLLGTSAWYAPGAAVSGMVQAIACDTKKIFPCSTLLEGEYGLNDLCIGVPVVLGKNGIESIVEITLSAAEKAHMETSAAGVSKTNSLLEL